MEHIDLRKLNASELKQVRSQVVRHKEMGKTGKEIEEITGVRLNRISEIWTAYQRDGNQALRAKKRGRKNKDGRLLTEEEECEIRQTIISKAPNQLKMAGFLWTLAKISAYIWKTYRKKVSVRSVSNYMKRWGLTCQRPTKRAYGQDIARVERFKKVIVANSIETMLMHISVFVISLCFQCFQSFQKVLIKIVNTRCDYHL